MATEARDHAAAAVRMAESQGMIRVRGVEERGIHREVLRRPTEQGRLVRVARGTYAPASAEPSTHHDLAVAALLVREGMGHDLPAVRREQVDRPQHHGQRQAL
ncbi:MAG: hypothetical protein D6693_01395, partial [Planctomycetota bacterium]